MRVPLKSSCFLCNPLQSSKILLLPLPSSAFLCPPLKSSNHLLQPFQFGFKLPYLFLLLFYGSFHLLQQLVLLCPISGARPVHAFLHAALLAESVLKGFQISVHHHIYLATHCVARCSPCWPSPRRSTFERRVHSLGVCCTAW